jgi:hypothetical protein
MGLWLKCPGCQTLNPLSLMVCPKCGRSLDNLPRPERVYVIGPPSTASRKAPAAPAQTPAPAGPAQPVKQPKKTRQKKK